MTIKGRFAPLPSPPPTVTFPGLRHDFNVETPL